MSAGFIEIFPATWSAPVDGAVPYGASAGPNTHPHVVAQQAGPEEPLNFAVITADPAALAPGNQGDREHLNLVTSFGDDPSRAEIVTLPDAVVVLPSTVKRAEGYWESHGITADYFCMPGAAPVSAVVLMETPEEPYTIDFGNYQFVTTEHDLVVASLRVLVAQALHPAHAYASQRQELVNAGW